MAATSEYAKKKREVRICGERSHCEIARGLVDDDAPYQGRSSADPLNATSPLVE